MKLFIDTNVLLSFFHLTSEDLEELRKLVALIENGEIELLLPDQVRYEFIRNRASKISDALKRLGNTKFNIEFPVFCKDYSQYTEIRNLQKEVDKKHAELVEQVTSDAIMMGLKADAIIGELFEKAHTIEITETIRQSALRRTEIGNPPGKKGSIGDAINWECLLATVNQHESVTLVSGDSDYASPLSEVSLNEFLALDWQNTNASEIIFFNKISEFFKSQYPQIKLASEVEKDLLIVRLGQSGSFARTHEIIRQLSNFSEFTIPQIHQLISILETNGQVHSISDDDDIQIFYGSLLKNYATKLDDEFRQRLEWFILEETAQHDDDDEIPF